MSRLGNGSIKLSLGAIAVTRAYRGSELVYQQLASFNDTYGYLFADGMSSSNLSLLSGGLWGGVPEMPIQGDDLILIIGQSNAVGYGNGRDLVYYDAPNDRIYQRGQSTDTGFSQYNFLTVQAQDPLMHKNMHDQNGVGFGMTFAKMYLQTISPYRNVLIIPGASGGTGFASNRWTPTGDLYLNAISQTNQVLAAQEGNKIAVILWLQGEADALAGMAGATYQGFLDAMFSGLRSSITGAADIPIIIGQMVPTWIAGNAAASPINAIHRDTPLRVRNTWYVDGPSGAQFTTDGIHYTGVAQRAIGRRMYYALDKARQNSTGVTPNAPVQSANIAGDITSTSLRVRWQDPDFRPGYRYTFEFRAVGSSIWILSSDALYLSSTLTGLPPAKFWNRTISSLLANTAYEFRITGANFSGNGTPRIITLTTLA